MKKIISIKFYTLLLLAVFISTTSIFAGTKGKISGKVIDESGEPLIGVQVFIENTTKGVLTDIDGNYTILNLDPGKYTVVFSYIGFATTKVQEVQVIVDKTTEVNTTLVEEIIEGQEVIVTAERPIVEKDRTTTTAYVSSEQLEELPIVSLNEAVNQQAGVVDGHFRGGRQGEVSYLVNGVPINNAFDNNASFEVEQNMVSSLEVISGVFNAEYGQALSGVVNIVTKGVADKWSANVLAYTGTIVSGRELEFVSKNTTQNNFLSASDFSQEKVSYTEASSTFKNYDVQFSAGGPIIKDKLGIQATVRYVNDPGYLIGRDIFRPNDVQSGVSSSGDQTTWLLNASGTGDFEELNRNERYSINTALVYEFNSRLKLDYNLFFQDGNGRGYDHGYKYNPNGINNYYNRSQTHILGLRYSIGQNSFANFSYSYLHDLGEDYLYDDATTTGVLDSRYAPPQLASQQGESAFNMGGNYLGSGQSITQTHTIVTDFTSQINNTVLFKTGLSARFHNLDNESFGITTNAANEPIRSNNPLSNSSLEVSPYEAAGYSQVKLEFENLIVNAGIRFDYFEPDYVVPIDISQIRDESIPDRNGAPGDSVLNRRDADASFQISPRLGIAFPISDTGVMRFSAGLFFQTPRLNLLYTNNEFEGVIGSNTNYGNAELGSERTLQFEVGLQQGLSETLALDFTLFSKDIRGLAGTEVARDRNGGYVSRLVNLDYGTIKGATLSLYQRGAGPISWTIDYTLQFASGSASDPNENFNRQVNGEDPVVKINRLNWDRRNVLNNTVTWNSNFGLTVSAINSLQTGTPYTSERNEVLSTVPNNEDKPIWFNSDARVYYKPVILKQDFQLFLQVDNIFDSAPNWSVYNDTGLATESTDLSRRISSGSSPGGLNSYNEFYIREDWQGPPRTIKVGFSLKF
ncbi:MAG: TonB-dependent receptor [Balneolaceae bacterium]